MNQDFVGEEAEGVGAKALGTKVEVLEMCVFVCVCGHVCYVVHPP